MAFSKEDAVATARKDLSKRLGVDAARIADAVEEADFPDMALGAGTAGEMSGQMITPGWRIHLSVGGKDYEYRANKKQVRLYRFKGKNYRVV